MCYGAAWLGLHTERWLIDKAIASKTQLDAPRTWFRGTNTVSYELSDPRKRETLVNYSGYQERMNNLRTRWSKQAGSSRQLLGYQGLSVTSVNLGGPSKRETLVNYSGYQEWRHNTTISVVQESETLVNYSGYCWRSLSAKYDHQLYS